jgi:hypothetical protein
MLLFRCLTYSSREITTIAKIATTTKAKEINNETMLLSELMLVGFAVSIGVGVAVGTVGEGDGPKEGDGVGAWTEVGPGVFEVDTEPSERLRVCVELQSLA